MITEAKKLLSAFAPLTVDAANSVAFLLGCDMDDFVYGRKGCNLRQLAVCFSTDKMANEVHVRFYGGPPGRGAWHDGTVETFVLDNILCALVRHGKDYTTEKLIGKQRK